MPYHEDLINKISQNAFICGIHSLSKNRCPLDGIYKGQRP